jgi:hypothetical protein
MCIARMLGKKHASKTRHARHDQFCRTQIIRTKHLRLEVIAIATWNPINTENDKREWVTVASAVTIHRHFGEPPAVLRKAQSSHVVAFRTAHG